MEDAVPDNKSSSVMPEAEAPCTYSVPEAGRLLGLSRNAAYDAARRHEIPCLRFGRKLRVPRVALEKMLADVKCSGRREG
jgi:excisionase family DNA binding protein